VFSLRRRGPAHQDSVQGAPRRRLEGTPQSAERRTRTGARRRSKSLSSVVKPHHRLNVGKGRLSTIVNVQQGRQGTSGIDLIEAKNTTFYRQPAPRASVGRAPEATRKRRGRGAIPQATTGGPGTAAQVNDYAPPQWQETGGITRSMMDHEQLQPHGSAGSVRQAHRSSASNTREVGRSSRRDNGGRPSPNSKRKNFTGFGN